MNPTVGSSILFLLHLLAVLVQLLVRQLVEGVGRFWFWWDVRSVHRRLKDKQRQTMKAFNTAAEGGGLGEEMVCSLPEDRRPL